MSWHFETRDQAPPPIAALYLLIGSLQGGALWFLHEASQVGSWPATEATAFRPLLAMAIFVPAVLLMGIGFIRPKSLTLWAVVTAILSAGLSLHSAFREGLTQNYSYTSLDQSAFYFFWLAFSSSVMRWSTRATPTANGLPTFQPTSMCPGDRQRSWLLPAFLSDCSGLCCGWAASCSV